MQDQEPTRAFPSLRYDRVCRTASSEAFLLSESEEPLGRVDLHYGGSAVHALIVLERSLGSEQERALIERIDEDLVWTADQPRDDFIATVYVGQETGVYSDDEGEEDEDDEEG